MNRNPIPNKKYLPRTIRFSKKKKISSDPLSFASGKTRLYSSARSITLTCGAFRSTASLTDRSVPNTPIAPAPVRISSSTSNTSASRFRIKRKPFSPVIRSSSPSLIKRILSCFLFRASFLFSLPIRTEYEQHRSIIVIVNANIKRIRMFPRLFPRRIIG